MKITKLLFVGLLLATMIGCQQDMNPVDPSPAPGVRTPLTKITLPAGVTVKSAILSLHSDYVAGGDLVTVHRITKDWEEMVVTYNTFGGAYDPAAAASFTNTATGWNSVDIATLVQEWVDGNVADYGVMLHQATGRYSVYNSSETTDETIRPKLVVTYEKNGVSETITIQEGEAGIGTVEDTYIMENFPTLNSGGSPFLYTGLHHTALMKYLLIKFDVTIESNGCTRTPGYWKNHTQRDPKRYDETWKQIGPLEENEPFFSGGTYYDVLCAPSAGGNAYYTLGQAYIAAELNQFAGASIPDPVLTAFGDATSLFLLYTPDQVGAWKGSQGERQKFLALATVLDDYNNGRTGPGHCEEDPPEALRVQFMHR